MTTSRHTIINITLISLFCCLTLFTLSVRAEAVDAKAIVAEHNKLRAEAGVTEALRYSPSLARSAQAWANHLQKSHHCQMQHSSQEIPYGENLYWSSAKIWSDGRKELRTVPAAEVITSWGSEKADYDHARNECSAGAMCGHYTQIVWRKTTQVGCAMATCSDSNEQVWVCHYLPAGNISGERPY